MVRVCFDRFGEPEEVLRLESTPLRDPAAGEVAVRMRLRPVNPSDLFQIRGRYGRLPDLPATPGLEGLGEVVALGEGVQDLRLGQRVVFREAQGTWTDVLVTRRELLIPVPEGVPDEAAAQAMVNPLTACAMIRELAPPEGAWVIVTAAASAVGHCLLDLARMRGFKVLALVRHSRHVTELLEAGAHEVLCTEDEGWFEAARVCLGPGAWGALDAVGGTQAARLAMLLRPGGTHLVYGALSLEALKIPGGQIIYRQLTVKGFMVFAWKKSAGEDVFRTTLAEVFDAQTQGLLCPSVGERFDLAQVHQAVRAAEQPLRMGKVLLM